MESIVPRVLSEAHQRIAHVLNKAVGAGDLATISQVLDRWPTQPSPGNDSGNCIPALWPFRAALAGAIETSNAALASTVLDYGLRIEPYALIICAGFTVSGDVSGVRRSWLGYQHAGTREPANLPIVGHISHSTSPKLRSGIDFLSLHIALAL